MAMSKEDPALCEKQSRAVLLESAFRSSLAVFATHILAGEVDTTLALDGVSLFSRLWWLLRYFNPVNLCWRYYSMLAYRLISRQWGPTQLALINFEPFPYHPPLPFLVAESIPDLRIRRLEISGILSSQGLLSIIAAYQGILATQYIISTTTVGYLATISKPLAMLGLFRVMVSNSVASKVYMDPFPYPSYTLDFELAYKSNKLFVCVWLLALFGLVFLSFWPYIAYPEFDTLKKNYLDLTMEIFYEYLTLSSLFFHIVLIYHGPKSLAHRILYFDHWTYKLQTVGFLFLLCGMVIVALVDFLQHDFYHFCKYI